MKKLLCNINTTSEHFNTVCLVCLHDAWHASFLRSSLYNKHYTVSCEWMSEWANERMISNTANVMMSVMYRQEIVRLREARTVQHHTRGRCCCCGSNTFKLPLSLTWRERKRKKDKPLGLSARGYLKTQGAELQETPETDKRSFITNCKIHPLKLNHNIEPPAETEHMNAAAEEADWTRCSWRNKQNSG